MGYVYGFEMDTLAATSALTSADCASSTTLTIVGDTIRSAGTSVELSYADKVCSVSDPLEGIWGRISSTIGDAQCGAKKAPDTAPADAKSLLYARSNNLYGKACKNGSVVSSYFLMPDIADLKVIQHEGKPQVVFVYFCDGTFEKAVLCEGDVFSIENAVSICVTKKLMDMRGANGSSLYNKVIKRALKLYDEKNRQKEEAEAKEAATKAKIEKLKAKRAAKLAKRKKAQEEKQIEIQKEAILRALRESGLDSGNRVVLDKVCYD